MKQFREYLAEKKAPKMEKPTASGFTTYTDLFQFIATNLRQSLDAKSIKTSDMYFKHYPDKNIVVYSGKDKVTIRKGDLKDFRNFTKLDDVEAALEDSGLKKK